MLLCGASVAAEYKIGFVNSARLLQGSPQAEAATQALEREFAPRRRELETKQNEIKTMEDRLNKDGAVMSESERVKLERNLVEQQRELKRRAEEFQEDVNFRRNDELGKIQRQFMEAIQVIAKEQKYDLIVSEGVIYASEQMDITGAVLEQLKKTTAAKP
ncbi:MAG: OmpH family outer membrane protein [Gammaproteobacteria bacterium]|nr:OmpH family outer membrane protein [Gammaproteobacteria bacterium]